MGFKKECGRRWRMILTAALLLFGCAGSLAGCSASGTGNAEAGSSQDAAGNGSSQNAAAGDGRLQVAATIFPYYDFLRQIGGDRIGLQLVVPAGMDSHSFEPTPADMIAMQEADILVCNGGAMEQWVSQVLSSLDTGDRKVLTMMDYVDVVEEELVEGMDMTTAMKKMRPTTTAARGIWTSAGRRSLTRRTATPWRLRTTNTYGRRR